jgi:hypothetical protein
MQSAYHVPVPSSGLQAPWACASIVAFEQTSPTAGAAPHVAPGGGGGGTEQRLDS